MGDTLARLLEREIDGMDGERDEVVSRMASAAGIEESTVNQILNGSIECPPPERIAGFARVLNISRERLNRALRADGCDRGEEE